MRSADSDIAVALTKLANAGERGVTLLEFLLVDDPDHTLASLEQSGLVLYDSWSERYFITTAGREFHGAMNLTGSCT